MLTNVYVDAFNLYYGCLKGTSYRWLDLDAFCRQLLPRDRIHRIRYFTALVSGRPGDVQQPQRQQTYLRAFGPSRTSPSTSATRCACPGAPAERRSADDSDLKVPIELAQAELGLVVGVVNPHPPARRSRALQPTFWWQVRSWQLQRSQFPPILADAKGAIRKPAGW